MSAQLLPFGQNPRFLSPAQRPSLNGGELDPATALLLMNSHFLGSVRDGEVGIFRIEDDETLTFLPLDQLNLLLSNIFVKVGGKAPGETGKSISIVKFWLAHPHRRWCRRIVFEPSGNVHPDDYNLWRGFAVKPKAGFQKQRRLLRHIYFIICRRDKAKFKYLMKYLAWTVQNPHRHAEVIVVFKSDAEGCGKSTLGNVMLEIFGPIHGLLVDNKEQLLGTFNAHLELVCFVLGEEVLWAGDAKTADLLKSRATAGVIPLEAKYRQQRQVTNRLHLMLTTNHSWAIAAGVQARRYFVCEVSDEVAQDRSWFDPLYEDLNVGGTAEFLRLLLALRLGDFHPRQVPKTGELVEQQIMSAGSVEQWLLACAEVDTLAGAMNGVGGIAADVATQSLYEAYTGYTKTRGARPESLTRFSRVMTELFGQSHRLPATQNSKRPPGYFIPDADRLRAAVLRRLKAGS